MRCALILCLLGTFARADEHGGRKTRFADGEAAFRAVKALLASQYADDQLTDEDLWRGAISGMLKAAGGRKWDELMSPEEIADMETSLNGELVGIGVQLKIDPDAVTILRPLTGSPAEKAGVHPGDRILKVDGRSLRGPQMEDVLHTVRGKSGTRVSLTLLREDDVVTVNVTRAPLQIPTVWRMSLANNVELVGVRSFNEKTPALLRGALEQAKAVHPRALVLDLRDNAGGLFERLIDSAGLLLPRGTVVVREIERGGREKEIRTSGEPVLRDVPTVVLVADCTASSAEILAGALRDQVGARLVGGRTAGKWNVQKVEKLPNGWAVKYTIGVFKTPKGQAPDGKGIDPDVPVVMDAAAIERAVVITEPAARVQADAHLRAALALLVR